MPYAFSTDFCHHDYTLRRTPPNSGLQRTSTSLRSALAAEA